MKKNLFIVQSALIVIISSLVLNVSGFYYNSSSPRFHDDNGETPVVPFSHRKSKFFPLFTILRFTNEICRTSSEEHGICYTKVQCLALGGQALGSCAQGLGVCCQFTATCGSFVNQNGTQFRNPNFPSKYSPGGVSDVCQIRIRKQYNIGQLRINFIKFDVEGPSLAPNTAGGGAGTMTNDAGSCKLDALTISSSGGTVPSLCGNLNNQHIYVEFGSSDTITINIMLSGNVQREREWNLEILQIPVNSVSRAPVGCLQYFQGVSGRIESFNFVGGMHLARMDYSSCVRMEDGMRAIEWTACNPGDVKISGPNPLPMPAPNPLPTPPCTNQVDYLIIMGGVSYPLPATAPAPPLPPAGSSVTDRFCDIHFGYATSMVRSTVRPFLLHFRSDMGEVAMPAPNTMDANVGFCLQWQQMPI